LLPEHDTDHYAVGDTLILNVGGQEQSVTLAGFYTVDSNPMSFPSAPLVVPRQVVQRFAPLQTRVFGEFPVASLSHVTTALGQALPDMLVFSLADINDALISQLQAFFTCAISVAGLAFVAGGVLIANAAGLNIVERYREIGIFKAVGYTSGHVLRAFLSEYGFLGILAGLFGISGAVLALCALNLSLAAGRLVIEPTILVGMLVVSVAIALLSAAVIAWQPTRVRPLEVLRYE
jgi:putative ABC transport system permease protein